MKKKKKELSVTLPVVKNKKIENMGKKVDSKIEKMVIGVAQDYDIAMCNRGSCSGK